MPTHLVATLYDCLPATSIGCTQLCCDWLLIIVELEQYRLFVMLLPIILLILLCDFLDMTQTRHMTAVH